MVYDPKKAREISIKGKQVTDAVKSGMQIQVAKTNKQNQSDRVTPAQLKLIQDSRGVQSPYQPKEAIDPLDPAQGVVDKAMLNPNTILLPFNVKDDSQYGVPGGGGQGPQPTDEESKDLLRRNWSNLQINPDVAHHNPDQPNNILNHILYDSNGDMWGVQDPKTKKVRELTPADRKKIQQEQQKHQQSQKSMMISDTRNLQKGLPPTGGKFGNIINQQAESYRGIDNDKLIDLQRLAAPLLIKNV